MLAKLISAVSGDKYMIGAHPPAWHSDAATREMATRDGDGLSRVNHDGELQKRVPAGAPPQPRMPSVPRWHK